MRLKIPNIKAALILAVLLSQIFCSAEMYGKRKSNERDNSIFSCVDSLMRSTLGNKVTETILDSDSVTVTLLSYDESIPSQTVPIDKHTADLTRLSLCKKTMYKGNRKVYTVFEPWVILNYYKGKNHVMVLLDFELRKWKVKKTNGKEISTFDMPDGTLLQQIYAIFPDNEPITKKLIEYSNKL